MAQINIHSISVQEHENQERAGSVPADGISRAPAAGDDVRILVIEDVPADAVVMMHQLRKGGIACVWQRVDTERALRDAVRDFHPNVVLSDFTLPGFDGLTALKVVREIAPELPFVFVSGTIGEERAIEVLRCEAVDYVLKTNLARLAPVVTRALKETAARIERRRQEALIARLTRVLRMLSGINGVVLRLRDRNELFEEACRLAVTVGGYLAAAVVLQQPGTPAIQTVACTGADQQAADNLRVIVTESLGHTSSLIRRILQTGTAFVCNNTADLDASEEAKALLAQAGFRAAIALPLLLDKTAIGMLILSARETESLSEEELPMLREVAATLSFALQYLQKDDAVHFLSYFDPLTGLAKRALFCERVERWLSRPYAGPAGFAVAVIDVEKLSVINDSFGRHSGDLLLQHVADRLRRCFHDIEWLAQFGGGTFAFALETIAAAADPATMLQQKLTAVFNDPFEFEGRSIPVTIKSGLALYPDDGNDAGTLVQNAEAALRNARTSGQRHLHYSIKQRSEVVARLALEHQLRTAIERREFELHYQPKVNASTGCIDGVEGLIRWHHPESGLICPGAFLPLLESTGLMVEVGDWVLEQAAADCQRWQRRGLPAVRIAVNISPTELRRPAFAQRFLQLTQPWANASCGLDVEITEGVLLGDNITEVNALKLLRAAGVRIAIDDFGTGYSSLSRLADLPIDTLKIDRTFIMRLPADRSGKTLVATIITLAHAIGMTVVAEGVETAEQLDLLCELGCDQLQGFLLSRPLAPAALAQLLETTAGQPMIRPGRSANADRRLPWTGAARSSA